MVIELYVFFTSVKGESEGKVHLKTGHQGPEGSRGAALLFP
jgi:hypothetical protein